MFGLLGALCAIFAVIDFAGMYFEYDLTGVSWSPWVIGGVGWVLMELDDDADDE